MSIIEDEGSYDARNPEAQLPLALRVFIVFASSACAGAGFAFALWALPNHTKAPQTTRALIEAQQTLQEIIPVGCTGDCIKKELSREDTTLHATPGGTTGPITADEDVFESPFNDTGKHLLVKDAIPTPVQKPVPVAEKKPLPAPKPVPPKAPVKTAPKPAPAAPTTVAVVTPVQQPQQTQQQVPQCSKPSHATPAGPIPMNPNNPGLQLVVDQPQYYTVFGNSAMEIRRQIARCSPVSGGFDAVTNWWYRYSYNYSQKPNGMCSINDVVLAVHVTFLLPQWKDVVGTNTALAQSWKKYSDALHGHEYTHKDIVASSAREALNAIQNFPESPCQNFVQTVNAYADAQLNIIQQRNDEYDRRTNHGAVEGAHFP
jgi:predicted secreted Zn-dependent protease